MLSILTLHYYFRFLALYFTGVVGPDGCPNMLIHKLCLVALLPFTAAVTDSFDGAMLPKAPKVPQEWLNATRSLIVRTGGGEYDGSELSAGFYRRNNSIGIGPQFQWESAAMFVGGYLVAKGSDTIKGIRRNCRSEQLDDEGDCYKHAAEVVGATILALVAGSARGGDISAGMIRSYDAIANLFSGGGGDLRKRIPCVDHRQDISDDVKTHFEGEGKGIRVTCRHGCRAGKVDSKIVEPLGFVATRFAEEDAETAQFTITDENKDTIARCRYQAIWDGGGATCPEKVTGDGCHTNL